MFEKLNKTDWKVLIHIADNPYRKFYLRELSRELKISPSSVKKALDILSKYNLIKENKFGNLRIISGNMGEILLKYIKLTKNIEFTQLLVKKLLPAISIILYGSFAKGENSKKSDIDICVITNKKVNYTIQNFKGYDLQIISMSPAKWKENKKSNPAYAKEIAQGILLYGEKPE